MKLCIVGCGYVGLVTGACLADVGNDVISIDKNLDKLEQLRSGKIPLFEPGLDSIVSRNLKEGRLVFTDNLYLGLQDAKICFVCVDTPPGQSGDADLSNVFAVAKSIGKILDKELVIVTKSTVPVGTTFRIKKIIEDELNLRGKPAQWIRVASNPEFLKEGDAVNDFFKPDRIVVGVDSANVSEILRDLYLPFMMKKERFVEMDICSAELAKYASNCMLAARISFMNELARLVEKVGADVSRVRMAMGQDPRIGPDFLYAGLGYGGSCFPKDVKAILHTAKEYGVKLSIMESVDAVNDRQREWFWEKIESYFSNDFTNLKLAIWGGAFKAKTDDIRCAPALYLIDKMLEKKLKIKLFDPAAMGNIKKIYGDQIGFCDSQYECLENVDALIITTDWNEFRSPDFEKMRVLMHQPVIFDGRNLYNNRSMEEKGFKYFCVGFSNRR